MGDSFPSIHYFYHTHALINALLNLKVDAVLFSGVCFLCDSFFSLICLMNSSCIGVPRHSALSLQLRDSAGPSLVFPLCSVIRKLSQDSKLEQQEISLPLFLISWGSCPWLSNILGLGNQCFFIYVVYVLFVWGQRENLVPQRTFWSGKMEVLA